MSDCELKLQPQPVVPGDPLYGVSPYYDISVYEYDRGIRSDVYMSGIPSALEYFKRDQLEKFPECKPKQSFLPLILILIGLFVAFKFFKK